MADTKTGVSAPQAGVWHQQCPACRSDRLSPNVNPQELVCDECGYTTVAPNVSVSAPAKDRTPRCESVDDGGYQCELLAGHPMPHRAIIGATDEQGPIPERQWDGPLAAENRAPSKEPDITRALATMDDLIAKQRGHVAAREQLAETEELPATTRARMNRNGRAVVEAVPADPEHGERHRRIASREKLHLADLECVRNVIAEVSRLTTALDRANRALDEIIARDEKGPEWEPYDEFGDPSDIDISNSGDQRRHGAWIAYQYAAEIARAARTQPEGSND